MKIQFFIRESLNDVVDQLSNSDFWSSDIKYLEDRRIIKIKECIWSGIRLLQYQRFALC